MLNIASVNMPKIKPETKVLIIKNLKSKSPAEIADIFNVSKRQVERIRKRYQDTGDVYSGSNNYLIPCWFCRFAHLQRIELSIILIIGTF